MHDHSLAASGGSYEHEKHEVFRHLPFPFADGRFPDSLGSVVLRTVLTEPSQSVRSSTLLTTPGASVTESMT